MPTSPASKGHMKAETWEALRLEQVGEMMDQMQFWENIPRRNRYLEVLNEVKAA